MLKQVMISFMSLDTHLLSRCKGIEPRFIPYGFTTIGSSRWYIITEIIWTVRHEMPQKGLIKQKVDAKFLKFFRDLNHINAPNLFVKSTI